MKKGHSVLRYFIGIVFIFVLWAVAAWVANRGSGSYFPTPVQTFTTLCSLLKGTPVCGASIFFHLKSSLFRWAAGFLLALLTGIPLGLMMGYKTYVFELFIPLLTFLQIIPGLAWIPVALLLFGLGEGATVFMIFITSLPPVVLNSAGGIRETPQVYLRASRMMGLTKMRFFFAVLLPASGLSIVNGLRIALASGWRVLIAAEMVVGSSLGLGYVIIQSRWSLDFQAAFTMILIIAAIGLLIEKVLFQIVENRIRRMMGYEEVR